MKLPLSWIHEYVNIDATPKQYADAMTMSGSKVEGVEYLGEEISNVVVGRIDSLEKHPDADRLTVCKVNIGSKELQILTAATNLTVGDLIPVALDGSHLAGGKEIKAGLMRGLLSEGMLCSFHELGLTINNVPYADSDGILLLKEGAETGTDIRKALGLDEYVVEFEITSNRPDCLSAIGLARETAVTFDRPLNLHTPVVKGSSGDINDHLSVKISDTDLCTRYSARIVHNIKIAPSPKWLRERLYACGVRPINNIVDITNYVMLEYGQPMHAFDYQCLENGQIIVRRASDGEAFHTLDGQERKLSSDMLVIADARKSVGIAGVMGGENSEISDNTKMIVFESANFNGASVRVTAKKLGMRTEASSRFEKGLDPQNTMPALERACELVELLGAGDVLSGCIDINYAPTAPRKLPLDVDAINKLLGIRVEKKKMQEILTALGFELSGDDVIVPSWRGDVERMCDIAEEIARIYGYDKIPSTLFAGETTQGALTESQQFEKTAGEVCRAVGFDEVMTYSFISPKYYDKIFMDPASPLRISTVIVNPLGEDLSIMRTTTLPSILEVTARNFNFRNPSANLYEIGNIYLPHVKDGMADPKTLPEERRVLALSSYGQPDFFAFKGCIETILDALYLEDISFEKVRNNPSYHPGRCADVYAGDMKVGVIGQVHPTVADRYEISVPIFAAELDFETLYALRKSTKLYTPLPRFPAATRDIAIVCGEEIPVYHLEKCIRKNIGEILESITLFDVYQGNQIAKGKKSVAYSISMRHPDCTLKDEEVDAAMKRTVAALESEFGASLRI